MNRLTHIFRFPGAAMLLAVLVSNGSAQAEGPPARAPASFATPQKAADALGAAWHGARAGDLIRIFGAEGLPLVRSGDRIADRNARLRLAAAFDRAHGIEAEGQGKAVLVLGEESWPYPIPLVRSAAGWRFDVKAGARQIIDRRIGRNELHAIETARAYVEAQRDYAERMAATGGRPEFARKLASGEGRRDGLYWPAAGPGDESPIGAQVAAAEARGYGPPDDAHPAPYRGYIFRILTKQGPHAPEGAKDYVKDGRMTGGFALIATPARYGDSGIMTFIVNQAGIVFERNLGPDTARTAAAIEAFDPGPEWKIAQP